MTPIEIRAAIVADPTLQALVAAGDYAAAARALTAAQPPVRLPTDAGIGTVLDALGLDAGNAFLDVLNTEPRFRYVRRLVDTGTLRLDLQQTADQLAQIVDGGSLPQAGADALLARVLTMPAPPVSWQEVLAATGSQVGPAATAEA